MLNVSWIIRYCRAEFLASLTYSRDKHTFRDTFHLLWLKLTAIASSEKDRFLSRLVKDVEKLNYTRNRLTPPVRARLWITTITQCLPEQIRVRKSKINQIQFLSTHQSFTPKTLGISEHWTQPTSAVEIKFHWSIATKYHQWKKQIKT